MDTKPKLANTEVNRSLSQPESPGVGRPRIRRPTCDANLVSVQVRDSDRMTLCCWATGTFGHENGYPKAKHFVFVSTAACWTFRHWTRWEKADSLECWAHRWYRRRDGVRSPHPRIHQPFTTWTFNLERSFGKANKFIGGRKRLWSTSPTD